MSNAVDIAWPVKAREMHNHHMNSTVWNSFKFRPDDIVVATYAKSGTTWTQQIIGQLIFNGAEGLDVPHLSPWVDLRIMPPEADSEGHTSRIGPGYFATVRSDVRSVSPSTAA